MLLPGFDSFTEQYVKVLIDNHKSLSLYTHGIDIADIDYELRCPKEREARAVHKSATYKNRT